MHLPEPRDVRIGVDELQRRTHVRQDLLQDGLVGASALTGRGGAGWEGAFFELMHPSTHSYINVS